MDLNTTAFAIVQKLSGQKPVSPRSSAARKAGVVGGVARAKVLTPERRKEIAAKANRTRWKDRK
jgi:hypothetical protein